MNKIHRLKRIQKLHKVATSSRGLFGDFSNGPSSPGEQTEFSMPKRKPLAERVPLPRPPKDPLVAAREAAAREAAEREAAEREARSQEVLEEVYPPMLMDEIIETPKPRAKRPRPTPTPPPPPLLTHMEWDDPIMPPHSFPRRPIATPPEDPEWMNAPDPKTWNKILREMDAPPPASLKISNRRNRLIKISQLLK